VFDKGTSCFDAQRRRAAGVAHGRFELRGSARTDPIRKVDEAAF